jgi:hypothetical protein
MSASNELSLWLAKSKVKSQTSGALQARIEKHKQKQLVFLMSLAQTFDIEASAKIAGTSTSLVTYKWNGKFTDHSIVDEFPVAAFYFCGNEVPLFFHQTYQT